MKVSVLKKWVGARRKLGRALKLNKKRRSKLRWQLAGRNYLRVKELGLLS